MIPPKQDNVGNIAINDSFMLEAAIYYLLKKHFRQEKHYVDLLEIFHEVRLTAPAELGSCRANKLPRRPRSKPRWVSSLTSSPLQKTRLICPNSRSTSESTRYERIRKSFANSPRYARHHLIVVYKTAFYSFYLPVALAMLQHGVPSSAPAYQQALDILLPLGEYFQVQDDYLDCYGKPEQIGKIGTDILDNKCGWLINTALGIATPEQRKVLDVSVVSVPVHLITAG